jgi:hypothetical protein
MQRRIHEGDKAKAMQALLDIVGIELAREAVLFGRIWI